MKNKLLIKISFLSGLIPMVVGWTIFLTWLLARDWCAKDLRSLELYGILWLYISFPIAIIGLVTTIIFFKRNYPNYKGLSFGGLMIILINIPFVVYIIDTHVSAYKHAYLKITNQSGQDSLTLSLIRSDFNINLPLLLNKKSTIVKYNPKYIYPLGETEYWSGVDTVSIILKNGQYIDTIKLPNIYESNCRQFIIDKELKVNARR